MQQCSSKRADLQDPMMYIADIAVLAKELDGVPTVSDIAKNLSEKIGCLEKIYNNAGTILTRSFAVSRKDAATMVDIELLSRQDSQRDKSSHESLKSPQQPTCVNLSVSQEILSNTCGSGDLGNTLRNNDDEFVSRNMAVLKLSS